MRLLFVKLKHIGDTLILTPTLAAVRKALPDAEIWVLVRGGCEGILAGCSAIDRLLVTAAPETAKRERLSWWRDAKLVPVLRRQKFDYAFELSNGDRGRWLACLSGARCRVAQRRGGLPAILRPLFHHLSDVDPWALHQVEIDFSTVKECLELAGEIPPLQFSREAADFSFVQREQLTDCIVLHPSTRWLRKQWPIERWIELTRELARVGPRLVLSSGPDASEVQLCREIRERSGVDVALTNGALNWPQMAGLFCASSLFVGVDTAAMHLAAACRVPSVALFGPSWEVNWRPWQCPHRIVTPTVEREPKTLYDRIVQARQRRMDDITIDQVLSACHEMLRQKAQR